MKSAFKNILKGKTVIVGVGNTLRGDDGFGPALIKRLEGKAKACCIDAGSAPENFTGKIIKEKPDTILIVDALHLGLAPGAWEILKKDEIAKSGLSTHDISPNMFIEYLESRTSADIYMLGVQPKDISFGREMSTEVKSALEKIADVIASEAKQSPRLRLLRRPSAFSQ
ncbi:MAG: hydrogenase maturation peptidase HycI [Candidatus Omnitrophica bacterium]|nr:hydrogenase maturation peptidase HycI [Candidatus Omnitrophota bacterium]MBU4141111.1 hydrogenase maturation peptidase HycI [Candidatus Omnitrophota bacterium]